MQHVRAHPVRAAHACHGRALQLALTASHGSLMGRIRRIKLNHSAAAHLEQHHIHPAPVPELAQAYLVRLMAIPGLFARGPGTLGIGGREQASRYTALGDIAAIAAQAADGLRLHDQLRHVLKGARSALLADEALTQQPARIG